jgi:hypothetical protein
MLKFLCPNGHPLNAPARLAGKHGKCPKCGAPFVVPSAYGDELELGFAELPPSVADVTAAGGSAPVTPAMGSGMGQAAAPGEVFVFLCPNGHKLNGPPSMKGKAGQCPHCGARFHIPTDEDIEEDEVPVGEADEQLDEGMDFKRWRAGRGRADRRGGDRRAGRSATGRARRIGIHCRSAVGAAD